MRWRQGRENILDRRNGKCRGPVASREAGVTEEMKGHCGGRGGQGLDHAGPMAVLGVFSLRPEGSY